MARNDDSDTKARDLGIRILKAVGSGNPEDVALLQRAKAIFESDDPVKHIAAETAQLKDVLGRLNEEKNRLEADSAVLAEANERARREVSELQQHSERIRTEMEAMEKQREFEYEKRTLLEDRKQLQFEREAFDKQQELGQAAAMITNERYKLQSERAAFEREKARFEQELERAMRAAQVQGGDDAAATPPAATDPRVTRTLEWMSAFEPEKAQQET
jgi:chromosome segregation ATPase